MTDPYLVALANCPVFGSRSLEKLFEKFSTAEAIWTAPEPDFLGLDLPESRLAGFFTFRKAAKIDAYTKEMGQHKIRLISKNDAEYPSLLKTIYDPPFVLFLRGAALREPAVAIVGSRKATDYGKKIATSFAKTLAQRGVSIVSGLAEGIDTCAYQGALDGSGHTVAILGGGLLQKSSREKEAAAQEILAKNGTVLSEFSLHSSFASFHFPMRNRIIAGMSRFSIIVEAALPSGSLITAKAALDAGREVFAVPGPIDSPTSNGTNNLIKDGAFVATSADDILLGLDITTTRQTATNTSPVMPARILPPLDPLPTAIYTHLEKGALFADQLVIKTVSSPAEVSRSLLELELLGLVRSLGGTRYERT